MAIIGNCILALGTFTATYLVFTFSSFVYTYLRPSELHRYNHAPNGSWAIVTGASDGIGHAFVQQLLKRGFNVVLHGRNQTKLEKIKASLQEQHPTSSLRTVTLDVSTPTLAQIESLAESIHDLPISVLINNVGGTAVLTTNFKSFATHTASEISALLAVNASFTTQLTRALLPTLTRNSPSLIINIGSVVASGFPYVPVYSATKAYLRALSRALAAEFISQGIDIEVLYLAVGETISQQLTGAPNLFFPKSSTLAAAALDRVGCGKMAVTAYWPHALQSYFVEMLPEWARRRLLTGILGPKESGKNKHS